MNKDRIKEIMLVVFVWIIALTIACFMYFKVKFILNN